MIRVFLTIMFCCICRFLFAYNAPTGTNIGNFENPFNKSYPLNPVALHNIPQGSDCVVFAFSMSIAAHSDGEALSIRNGTDNKLLDVQFDDEGRIIISRPFNGKMLDYKIYDLMLDYSSVNALYEFRIFLCENFMWLEVINSGKTLVTPIFFGGKLPQENIVERILTEDSSYEIVFGGEGNSDSTRLMPGPIKVYATTYSALLSDISGKYVSENAQMILFQNSCNIMRIAFNESINR